MNKKHEKNPIEIQYPAQILTEFRITIIILGFHCGLTGVSGMEKYNFFVFGNCSKLQNTGIIVH